MGTNYYIKGYDKRQSDGECVYDDCDPAVHIGKRSAAGLFCFDCGVTLCKGGKERIHFSQYDWHDACPQCGKTRDEEKLTESSAGLELGFNKNATAKKTGVKSCSSWTWAMNKQDQLNQRLAEMGQDPQGKCVVNEYGDEFTLAEFLELIDACPVHYEGSIGGFFS